MRFSTPLGAVIVMALLANAALARPGNEQGIWKSFVPRDVKGEFAGKDPMGLIAGKLIQADCSLNWRDQHGKLYCFSSGTSLVYFLQMPNTNAQRAREFWQKHEAGPKPADLTQ